ncbi:hypothetical protein SALBM135S_04587 [Streptomyces alboniger]
MPASIRAAVRGCPLDTEVRRTDRGKALRGVPAVGARGPRGAGEVPVAHVPVPLIAQVTRYVDWHHERSADAAGRGLPGVGAEVPEGAVAVLRSPVGPP